jgi:hypothetical protein
MYAHVFLKKKKTLSQAEWQYPVNRTESGWQTTIPIREFGSEAREAGRMQILELHAKLDSR